MSVDEKYELRLYVVGGLDENAENISQIKKMLMDECKDSFALEVIDVLLHPEQASSQSIVATPTLIRMRPNPVRMVIVDFADKAKLQSCVNIVLE